MYRGILNLRSENDEIILTDWQLAEIEKCKADPEYFFRNYCYIHTKDKGMALFDLRPAQVAEINTLQNWKMVKSDWYRQSSYTTLGMLFLLWRALFFPHTCCLYMVPKKELAYGNFKTIIREAYISLPFWMQQGVKEWTNHSIVMANGSLIYARPASADNARGIGWEYIFIDEFGWIKDKEMMEIANSLFPSINQSAKVHLILAQSHRFGKQTPANLLFWENTTLPFHESVLTWDQDTLHDAKWAEDMVSRIGDKKFKQEYCGILFTKSNRADSPERFGKWTYNRDGGYPNVPDYEKGRYLCIIVSLYRDTGLPVCEPFFEVLTVNDNGHFAGLKTDTKEYEQVLAWMPLPPIPYRIKELLGF